MIYVRNILVLILFTVITFFIASHLSYSKYNQGIYKGLIDAEYNRIVKLAEGTNKMVHFPLATANNDPGSQMSPDVLYSAMSYELGDSPLGVYIPLPASSWTLSVYDEEGRNYYSLDNRLHTQNKLEIALVPEGRELAAGGNARVIKSPGNKGVVVVRYIIPLPASKAGLTTLRNEIKTGLINTKNN